MLNRKLKDRADLGHSQRLGPATGTPGDVQAVDAPLETSFAKGAVSAFLLQGSSLVLEGT